MSSSDGGMFKCPECHESMIALLRFAGSSCKCGKIRISEYGKFLVRDDGEEKINRLSDLEAFKEFKDKYPNGVVIGCTDLLDEEGTYVAGIFLFGNTNQKGALKILAHGLDMLTDVKIKPKPQEG